jgi:hypothetical protein
MNANLGKYLHRDERQGLSLRRLSLREFSTADTAVGYREPADIERTSHRKDAEILGRRL